MLKKLFLLAAMAAMITQASAINDLAISIDDGGAGICLASENLTASACGGETLTLDGTQDHLMYFVPEAGTAANASVGQQFEYAIVTPLGLILSLFFVILAIGMTLGAVTIMMRMIRGVGNG
jgi:hypothetical protein